MTVPDYYTQTVVKNAFESAENGIFAQRKRFHEMSNGLQLYVPSKSAAHRFTDKIIDFFFPTDIRQSGRRSMQYTLLKDQLKHLLEPLGVDVAEVADKFFAKLPSLFDKLLEDAQATLDFDPAASSLEEVIATYPGFYATTVYRLAHEFVNLDVPLLPRMLTEYAHSKTGIDIHPAAQIGRAFVIDHGTGIVIGATSRIGNHVKIYHGVTLGALQVDKSLADTKRHPTVEDHVIIYANATVLGGETVLGHHSIVGGNVWVTKSVPPHSRVYFESRDRVRTPQPEGIA